MTKKAALMIAALAAGTAGALIQSPAIAAKKDKEEAKQGPDLSAPVRTALLAAQTALAAKDFPTATTQLAAAQAALSTPDDRWFTGNMEVQLGQNAQNNAVLSQGIDNMIASGKAPADKLPTLYSNQAALAAQAKDYAKAEAALRKLNELQPNNASTLTQLAQVASLQHHAADVTTFSQQAMAAAKASGQAPDENLYLQQLQSAYSAKDNAGVVTAGIALVSNFPSATNWTKALQTFEATTNLPESTMLDLWRLERETGAADQRTYTVLATYAFDHGLPGEARNTIDLGMAAHKINSPDLTAMRAKASAQVAADQAGLAAAATRARAAANGHAAMGTGDDYLGYSQFDRAAALYQVALQKGGVDLPTANLRLGMALALNGDKAGAKAALAKVTGPAQPIAQYWSTWVDHP